MFRMCCPDPLPEIVTHESIFLTVDDLARNFVHQTVNLLDLDVEYEHWQRLVWNHCVLPDCVIQLPQLFVF